MKNERILLEKLSLATGLTINFGEIELYSRVQEMMKMESVAQILWEQKIYENKKLWRMKQTNLSKETRCKPALEFAQIPSHHSSYKLPQPIDDWAESLSLSPVFWLQDGQFPLYTRAYNCVRYFRKLSIKMIWNQKVFTSQTLAFIHARLLCLFICTYLYIWIFYFCLPLIIYSIFKNLY